MTCTNSVLVSFLDKISLQSRYKISKLFGYKGQDFVCRVVNFERSHLLAFTDEKLFHSFSFFVQTQTKLREELEGKITTYLLYIELAKRTVRGFKTKCSHPSAR